MMWLYEYDDNNEYFVDVDNDDDIDHSVGDDEVNEYGYDNDVYNDNDGDDDNICVWYF